MTGIEVVSVAARPPLGSLAGPTMTGGATRDAIVALHCSGSSAAQWRRLGEAAADRYELRCVEFYGCGGTRAWSGQGAFALADESARVLAAIDGCPSPVYLVGHSYGGAVAIQAALRRPGRIAGMALYEPTVFHLLRHSDRDGDAAYGEIAAIAAAMSEGVLSGDYRGAASRFVDYWNGTGCWAGLAPEQQDGVLRWIPKAPLEFRALFDDPTPPAAYAGIACPMLMLRGQHAPAPTRLAAERLAARLAAARLETVAGAGHMGPITHAGAVNRLLLAHADSVLRPRADSAWTAPGPRLGQAV